MSGSAALAESGLVSNVTIAIGSHTSIPSHIRFQFYFHIGYMENHLIRILFSIEIPLTPSLRSKARCVLAQPY